MSVLIDKPLKAGIHSLRRLQSVDDIVQYLYHVLCDFSDGKMSQFPDQLIRYITEKDTDNDTVLHLALIHQHQNWRLIETILTLAEQNVNLSLINEQNESGQSALHIAAIYGNAALAANLLRHGSRADLADHKGSTPVHVAIELGNTDVLRQLLDQSNYRRANHDCLDLNQLNHQGMSPLHLAVISGNQVAVELLCRHGADVNCGDGTGGRTPLHFAVKCHHPSVPALLSQRNINVDQQDFSGNSALHLACSQHSQHLVQLLLKSGADPYLENFDNSFESWLPDDDDDVSSCDEEMPSDARGRVPLELVAGPLVCGFGSDFKCAKRSPPSIQLTSITCSSLSDQSSLSAHQRRLDQQKNSLNVQTVTEKPKLTDSMYDSALFDSGYISNSVSLSGDERISNFGGFSYLRRDQ